MGKTVPVKAGENDFAIITMQHSEGGRQRCLGGHREVICNICHSLATSCYGVRNTIQAASKH